MALGLLLILVFLLCLSGFFSGSETALFSITRLELNRYEKDPSFRFVRKLLENPGRTLVAILLGNLFVNIFATTVAEMFFGIYFPDKAELVTFVVMTTLILVFGEILPKIIAINVRTGFARLFSRPLYIISSILAPLRALLEKAGDFFIRLFAHIAGPPANALNKEEWLHLLSDSHTTVKELKKKIAIRLVNFADLRAKDLITPRKNLAALDLDSTPEQVTDLIKKCPFSRYPVYEKEIDNIKGYIHLKDLFCRKLNIGSLREILRPPLIVPGSKKLGALLKEMIKLNSHLSFVINEYGGLAGVVTMNDVLGRAVGSGLSGERGGPIRKMYDGTYSVDGAAPFPDFIEIAGIEGVEKNRTRTVNGFIISAIGRIPQMGENIEIEGIKFYILDAGENFIRRVIVSVFRKGDLK
ncbi:MAG: hemolysin family protein [Fibrobacterota bacterium]